MSNTTELRARSRAQLSASGITVERGGRAVLNDVSVSVRPGMRLGIVGENGRGKSTLLQVLSGALAPDVGTVRRVGSCGIAEQEITADVRRTVDQLVGIELVDARTALQALDDAGRALADAEPGAELRYADALDSATVLGAWDAERRVDLALEALGAITDRSRRLAEMSVGERYRVRLACLLGANHDFLLLDEPTNHLDQRALDFLTDTVRGSEGGIVVVSHDRVLLADIATKVLDLDPSQDGTTRLYGDGYGGFLAGRERELARWTQEYDQHQSEQRRLVNDLSTAQNRLQSGWRPPKGTGKHQRATRAPSLVRSVNRRLDDLTAHAVNKPEAPLRFRMPELPALGGTTLVRVDEVTVFHRLIVPVSVALSSKSRLLVTGPNGVGKSTLLAVLAGHLQPDSGIATLAPQARIGLVAQESPSRDERSTHTVYESRLQDIRAQDPGASTVSLRSLGLLSAAELSKPVAELSMGQQRRLDIALALAGRPHVLLLDEPTNHISITLVEELTDAFGNTKAAIALVTHDRQLRRDLAGWPNLDLAL
jgi:macrolide transport system ATP-binding/permease protein